MSITIRVNGTERQLDVDPEMPLLWALRDVLGLTGTKYGCGEALCGACTVHLDGQAVRSCVTPVRRAASAEVTTIEGLSPDGNHPLQKAWVELGVPQCGFCQAGQLMTAAALLKKHPRPTDEQIDQSHGRQPVPVRHLHADPRGDQEGRREADSERGRAADPETVVPPCVRPHRGRSRARLLLSAWTRNDPRTSRASRRRPSRHRLAGHGSPGRGPQPQRLRPRRAGRHRDHRLPPLGDGPGHPQLAAGLDRRRARRADGAREDRAGRRRQGLRRPEHRRLEQHPRHLRGHAPSGRDGARDARRRRREALERRARRTVSRGITPSPISPTGRALGFGELALEAGKQKVPAAKDVALRPVSELTHLGKPLPLLDGPAYVTGQAIYGADVKIPGMLTAVIARPPVVGGKVARFDATRALAVPGVRKVIEIPPPKPPYAFQPWGGVAVVADHTWAAHAWPRRARRDVGARARTRSYDSAQYRDALAKAVARARERSHARSVIRRRR